jgi:Effector-associated domain 11
MAITRNEQPFPYRLHPEVESIADLRAQSSAARTLADLYKLVFLLEKTIYAESAKYKSFSEIKTLITSDSPEKGQSSNLKVRLDELVNSLQPEDLKSHQLLQTVLFPRSSGKDAVRELIAKGDLKSAIAAMKDVVPKKEENTLLMLTGRFNQVEKNQQMGIMSSEEYNMERNRISAALLGLLDDLA